MSGQEFLEFGAQGVALVYHDQELASQSADDATVLFGGGDRDALLGQSCEDLTRQGVSHAWGTGCDECFDPGLTEPRDR